MGHVTSLSRAKLHGISRIFQVKFNANSCWQVVCEIYFYQHWRLIFVYVTLCNPPCFGGFFCGQTSLTKFLVGEISHLYRMCWKNCCRSSSFSDTSATSIQKYLFYEVACFLCKPAQCNSLGCNPFNF